jgi:hypothetical protein
MSIVLVGSTSGSITLQEPAIAGTTVLDLPAVSGTILTTASSGQSIPKAALPTGSVLQVVNSSYGTETQNNTSTYADTGLTANITPLYSTSKILILVCQAGIQKITNNTTIRVRLIKNSTTQLAIIENEAGGSSNSNTNSVAAGAICYLDSPATTSSVNYKTQFLSSANNEGARVQAGNSLATITLMEIAA